MEEKEEKKKAIEEKKKEEKTVTITSNTSLVKVKVDGKSTVTNSEEKTVKKTCEEIKVIRVLRVGGDCYISEDIASTTGNVEEVAGTIDKEIPETRKMLQLTASQKMNNDARRAIFCVIMSGEDYVDAFEKLQRLDFPGRQVNTASGMDVHDDCKLRFLKLKAKRTHGFIVFKIEEKQKQVRSKMIYASSKDTFKRELDGIQVELQATDPTEMGLDVIQSRASKWKNSRRCVEDIWAVAIGLLEAQVITKNLLFSRVITGK
ncbi:hypothetical protein BUALT_Bualt09G0113200 [Buddleja alternifolia]|uniref:ADF-H domain-containing protein n=1 Tax=Buddleja alternifolia TaxID=168488 RepID=A0AAV6X9U4_9LAMI|nr:hypothetical protein BUALT_Bualt09G0113200 [Buddleja alternifolia]